MDIDLPCSHPPAQSQDCSQGHGETVSCSIQEFDKDCCSVIWNEPCISPLVQHCNMLTLNLSSPNPSQVSTRALFYTLLSHSSRRVNTAVLAHKECRQRQHVGYLQDVGAASHVSALILHKVHGAHAHNQILACW